MANLKKPGPGQVPPYRVMPGNSLPGTPLVGTFYSIFEDFFFSGIKNSTVKLPGNKFQPAESEEGTAYRNVIK